jgi:hypothetical protein
MNFYRQHLTSCRSTFIPWKRIFPGWSLLACPLPNNTSFRVGATTMDGFLGVGLFRLFVVELEGVLVQPSIHFLILSDVVMILVEFI